MTDLTDVMISLNELQVLVDELRDLIRSSDDDR